MPAAYNKTLLHKAKILIDNGLTNKEIAQELKLTVASVSIMVNRKLGGNSNYLKRISKHNHLHEKVLLFRLQHNDIETAEHFGLTASELKSCLTFAYRNKDLSLIRKDNRRKDPWTVDQMTDMLKYCGILRRSKIASLIDRGIDRVIKEKLSALGVSSRNVNGGNISQFRRLFNCEPHYLIRGEAGPGSTNTNRFVIVPWFHFVEKYREVKHNDTILKAFECYAMFSEFVWKGHPWTMMMKDKNISSFLCESMKDYTES